MSRCAFRRRSPASPLRRRGARTAWIGAAALLAAGHTLSQEPGPPPADPAEEAATPAAGPPARRAVIIRFDGIITPLSTNYLSRKLDEALAHEADLVIVQIDSPGGEAESSKAIAEMLRDYGSARTVAYVPREAISGAAFLSLGCDEIVLHPEARLGDAGPIFLDEDFAFRHAPEKYRSDLAEWIRNLAEAKGRPPALAEAMVDMDLAVFEVRHRTTGETDFLSEKELASLPDPDEWEKLAPVFEAREDHFLVVSGRRAVELRLADAVVQNREELLARYGSPAEVRELEWGWVDTFAAILNHWFVTGLLIAVGLIALYVELSSPGIGVGGLIALLCAILFFWSRFLGGTAGWLEVLLFVTGAVFLAVELFVLPGFGVAGVLGLLLMTVSLVLASQDFLLPERASQWRTLAISSATVLGAGFVFAVAAALFSQHFGRLPLFNRLVLTPPAQAPPPPLGAKGAEEAAEAAPGPYTPAVGDWGVAVSPLRPAGKIRVGREPLDVVADGSFVEKGRSVRIVRIDGSRIVVREVEGTA